MDEIKSKKKRFFNSLKCGTGEAYLIAKENPAIDFSAYIIKGALTNYAYDGQSEGTRAQYIYDLISIVDKEDRIRKTILQGLANEQDDTWSLVQLFELAGLYAERGDKEAKQAIYQRFLKNPIDGSDWVGYQQILELDGLKGLLFIATRFGEFMEKNPNDWQDDWIINHFQNENPEINALNELKKVANNNKYIRIYLETIERTKKSQEKHKRPKQTFNNIIDEVLQSKPFLSFKRIKEVNETELVLIAEALLKEKDKSKLEKLIQIFTLHRFPLDEAFILNLAKKRYNSKNRIKEYAIQSLKFLKSKEVRAYALERIPKTNTPRVFTNILCANYKSGDFSLLNEVANKFKNEHIIESLASSYSDIYSINKVMECKMPLETLYRKMTCGIHRNIIIEILLENKVLSPKIKREIKYDSYLETRKLATEGLN